MSIKTILLGFGGAFILYFIASVLNMISLRIEDSGKEYPIVEHILAGFVVLLYIFSLPVSVPCFLLDSFHSRRALKRHDSAMLEAAVRYSKKCDSCPADSAFKRERPDFGYDKDNLRFLPYEPDNCCFNDTHANEPPSPVKSKRPNISFNTSLVIISVLVFTAFILASCILQLNRSNLSLRSDLDSSNSRIDILESVLLTKRTDLNAANKKLSDSESQLSATTSLLDDYKRAVVFISSSGSKYHNRDCHYLNDSIKIRIYTTAAVSQGYSPCLFCRPFVPLSIK